MLPAEYAKTASTKTEGEQRKEAGMERNVDKGKKDQEKARGEDRKAQKLTEGGRT